MIYKRINGKNHVRIFLAVVALNFLFLGGWMIRNHPYQNIYFSIPSSLAEGNFELDYWGLSYREGFEFLTEYDDDKIITVFVTTSPAWENLNILTSKQRRRIVIRNDVETSKYVIDNYRWSEYEHVLPEADKIHAVTVDGMEILGVYKNPNWKKTPIKPSEIMEDYFVALMFGNNILNE